jgi:hypothetical protein
MQRLDVPSNAILVRSAAALEQAQWGVQEAFGSAYSKDPFRQTWSLLEDQKVRLMVPLEFLRQMARMTITCVCVVKE